MRVSRDLVLVVLLFAALVGLTGYGALRQAQAQAEQEGASTFYSTHNATNTGTMALKLWFEAQGFKTERLEFQRFSVNPQAHVFVLLAPIQAVQTGEAQELLDWVARGNTLITADSSPFHQNALLTQLGARLRPLGSTAEYAPLEQPLLSPLPPNGARVRAAYGLALDRSDYVTLAGTSDLPVWVALTGKGGNGRIWLASTIYPLTNEGLHDAENAALVGALIASMPRGSLVVFDEYHLGLTGDAGENSLSGYLVGTPWGWGILYAFGIVGLYLVVNGKRFGRVLPLPQDLLRRNPAEYVTSMAQLFRRGGKRGVIAAHYHQQLKRRLGRPYRINADLPDAEFLDELARFRDDFDRPQLEGLLRALAQPHVSESALVKLAEQAAEAGRRG